MLGALARSLFGTANDRVVKGFDKPVAKINALEPELAKLSDEQLRAKTTEFRERLAKGETLDDLLVEAFATVREAAKRTLGQRHFDVQLKGGMVLHQGKIAEMKTGEGKTLVATLPVYLNALEGKGVHVVTVNDYLAKRDSEWMGQIYKFLGLSVGVIVHELDDEQRKAAYACDVTYGTNNEIGFDYLRDNMKYRLDAMAQRPFNYAIVDEVDSILIDEARTPLIISGPAEDSSELYRRADTVIPRLQADHYEKDEKNRTVVLTDAGVEAVEDILRGDGLLPEGISLYAPTQVSVLHHVTQALRAHKLFARDVDYIVKDGQVVIIDEFTGRMMAGRRYSEGLHQALEAKEKVEIQRENQTLASITFQNLFRMYPKLAGMTGTALTEAAEFGEIYRLEVVEIPTNVAGRPQGRRRRDLPHARRQDARHRQADRGMPRAPAADAGRHGVDREVGGAVGGAEEGQDPAQRAERALPRAGSRDRRPGRPAGRRHHRHQHGRPRHRHPAGRQRRHAGAPVRSRDHRQVPRRGRRARPSSSASRRRSRPRSSAIARSCSRRAASTWSAPSATRAGASTTSCAAARAARAIPARRSSSCRWKTT